VFHPPALSAVYELPMVDCPVTRRPNRGSPGRPGPDMRQLAAGHKPRLSLGRPRGPSPGTAPLASRRSDDSLAATYSVYSASRPRLTANCHASSHAPRSLEARGAAFGCHPRQDSSIRARSQGPGEHPCRSTCSARAQLNSEGRSLSALFGDLPPPRRPSVCRGAGLAGMLARVAR
jgi:hypothetical protein